LTKTVFVQPLTRTKKFLKVFLMKQYFSGRLVAVILLLGGLALSGWSIWLADRQLRSELLREMEAASQNIGHIRVDALSGTSADRENPYYHELKKKLSLTCRLRKNAGLSILSA